MQWNYFFVVESEHPPRTDLEIALERNCAIYMKHEKSELRFVHLHR